MQERPLPSQRSQDEIIARMLRVNLAGEYGAKRIYEGQLDVLENAPSANQILHMKEQEEQHLQTFENLVVKHRVRPTVLQPLWHVAGYALGKVTALMGEKAAMACTVAVEDVIDEHYQKQLKTLGTQSPELSKIIKKFREEELEHKQIALEEGAEEAVGYPILSNTIKTASRLAIWLSTRL